MYLSTKNGNTLRKVAASTGQPCTKNKSGRVRVPRGGGEGRWASDGAHGQLLSPVAAAKLNASRLLFDPKLARPFVLDWERVAKTMLSTLQREVLINSEDERLRALLTEIQGYPDLPPGFRDPDLSSPSEATLTLRMKRDDLELGFITTLTSFSAPQNVTLEELRIESYFPADEATTRACEQLALD